VADEDDENSIAVVLLQPRRMEDDRSFSYQNLACGIDNVTCCFLGGALEAGILRDSALWHGSKVFRGFMNALCTNGVECRRCLDDGFEFDLNWTLSMK
jgi:hypothetical protein